MSFDLFEDERMRTKKTCEIERGKILLKYCVIQETELISPKH